MKAEYGWNPTFLGYDGNGTNSSGFAGLPGGYTYGITVAAGQEGLWWSSLAFETLEGEFFEAFYRTLNHEGSGLGSGLYNFNYGLSVRCVRDTE